MTWGSARRGPRAGRPCRAPCPRALGRHQLRWTGRGRAEREGQGAGADWPCGQGAWPHSRTQGIVKLTGAGPVKGPLTHTFSAPSFRPATGALFPKADSLGVSTDPAPTPLSRPSSPQDPPSWPGSGASLPPKLLPLLPFQAGHVEPPPDEDALTPALGGTCWTDGFWHLDHSGPASARSLPERKGRGAGAVVGPSSLRVGTPCPSSRPPPLGLWGQETRQRWQSSQEGQRDQVKGGKPSLATPH